jgi:hypothetical protein
LFSKSSNVFITAIIFYKIFQRHSQFNIQDWNNGQLIFFTGNCDAYPRQRTPTNQVKNTTIQQLRKIPNWSSGEDLLEERLTQSEKTLEIES